MGECCLCFDFRNNGDDSSSSRDFQFCDPDIFSSADKREPDIIHSPLHTEPKVEQIFLSPDRELEKTRWTVHSFMHTV